MALNPKTVERNLANILRELRSKRTTIDKGIIDNLKILAKALNVQTEKLVNITEEVNDEIEIVGGSISQLFKQIKENHSRFRNSLENITHDINSFKYVFSDINNTYGSIFQTLERIKDTAGTFSSSLGKATTPIILGIGVLNHLSNTMSQLAQYGLEYQNVFLMLEKAQLVFLKGHDDIIDMIKNNALLVQEYGLQSLEEITRQFRNSANSLYKLGFSARDLSGLIIDVLGTQRMLLEFDQRQTVIERKFLLNYFKELYKTAAQTGISVSKISETIKELSKDPETRFIFSMVPYNVQIALGTIAERFPSVFPILSQAIKRGFSIYRVDELANIQLIGMERKFQKWLDEIKSGVFTFDSFLKNMHGEVGRLDEFARINFFRQQEEAARLASNLAYETRQTVLEVNMLDKRKAVNEINALMQNTNLLMLETQIKLYETLNEIVFSPQFDNFLSNFIDIMNVKAPVVQENIENMEKKTSSIQTEYSTALLSQAASFGMLGIGSTLAINSLKKTLQNINPFSLSRPFQSLFDLSISTLEQSSKILNKTSSLVKHAGKIAKSVGKQLVPKAGLKGKFKIPLGKAEKLLKIRLGPLAGILASLDYWVDMVNLYASYTNGEISESDFKLRFASLIGKAAGGLGGMGLIGSLGGMIGSVVPGAGTILGGFIGGTIGLFGGEYVGEQIGEFIAEHFILGENSNALDKLQQELQNNAHEIKKKALNNILQNTNLVPVAKEYLETIKQNNMEINDMLDEFKNQYMTILLEKNSTKDLKFINMEKASSKLGEK